jgi:hypothetical protein
MTEDTVRDAFRRQAAACDALGSLFTARLSRLAAERLDEADAVGEAILAWQGDPSPSADSVPLRLAGALHGLVIEGRDPDLRTAYPPNAASDDALWQAIAAAMRRQPAFILERLGSPPQTNEVRRSAALLPGFLTIADLFGKPLVLSELGASAGLNLYWDHYRYGLGETAWGDASSPVAIEPEWTGAPPPKARIDVLDRAGCDLNPIDISDPAARLRLLSYIWADQTDRMARTSAALKIVSTAGTRVEKRDAIEWMEERLKQHGSGTTHVVYHTIAWQYFPKDLQAKGEALLEDFGRHASIEAPLARLALEADGAPDGASLTLQVWPTGEKQEIARADFHGRWVRWKGWT